MRRAALGGRPPCSVRAVVAAQRVAGGARAPRVAGVVGELGQPHDLPLALDAGRVVGGKALDQRARSGCGSGARSGGSRGPASARMSSTLAGGRGRAGLLAPPRSSRGSLSAVGPPLARPSSPAARPGARARRLGRVPGPGRARGPARCRSLTGASLVSSSTCAWKATESALAVADQPDVVVEGARRVVDEARAGVAEEALGGRRDARSPSSVTSSGPGLPPADSGAAAAASSGRSRVGDRRTRGRGR